MLPRVIDATSRTGHLKTQANCEPESVVLLHGLGRGPWSLKLLELRLWRAGFEVHNLRYSSRAHSIDEIVIEVHEQYHKCCTTSNNKTHFVTHSLGALVARAYLAKNMPVKLGRLVMLAPPNGGSEIVDHFRKWLVFRILLGPIAPQLGTGPNDLPARLPIPNCDIGVIAGNLWINPLGLFAPSLPHDGSISVNRTYLKGMKDHIVVQQTHSLIMNSTGVTEEIISFLRNGTFKRSLGLTFAA